MKRTATAADDLVLCLSEFFADLLFVLSGLDSQVLIHQ